MRTRLQSMYPYDRITLMVIVTGGAGTLSDFR
jgi:hypothetical protein